MRILVAMSGGVDSSVAAALLARDGHDVVGCTLRLWGGASDSGCCSVADVEDARRVAQVLGIDHHVFNLAEEFTERVVEPYVAAHAGGSTPNPCVACNREIKFGALSTRARRLGFDAVATGHHARVSRGTRGYELRRGADRSKDQSYVLGFLGAEVLRELVLPIGEIDKHEVREIARGLGLRTAAKPDSQDVCFIPRGRREPFLAARTALTAAAVVDRATGETLGSVRAAQLVTLGQRRGLGVGRDGAPRYVVDVDLPASRVLVDRLEGALVWELDLEPGSLRGARGEIGAHHDVAVQTSAHGAALGARLGRDATSLLLDRPVRPVAPGQLAVLYDAADPDLVLGAATVARRARAAS